MYVDDELEISSIILQAKYNWSLTNIFASSN